MTHYMDESTGPLTHYTGDTRNLCHEAPGTVLVMMLMPHEGWNSVLSWHY